MSAGTPRRVALLHRGRSGRHLHVIDRLHALPWPPRPPEGEPETLIGQRGARLTAAFAAQAAAGGATVRADGGPGPGAGARTGDAAPFDDDEATWPGRRLPGRAAEAPPPPVARTLASPAAAAAPAAVADADAEAVGAGAGVPEAAASASPAADAAAGSGAGAPPAASPAAAVATPAPTVAATVAPATSPPDGPADTRAFFDTLRAPAPGPAAALPPTRAQQALDAVAEQVDSAAPRWPEDLPGRLLRVPVAPGQDAHLLLSRAWLLAVDDFAAVCDLAASASPAQWLLRLEERLLGAAFRDPGDYVALAWWDGDLPAETTPWRPSSPAPRRHEDEPTLVPRIAPVRRDGP